MPPSRLAGKPEKTRSNLSANEAKHRDRPSHAPWLDLVPKCEYSTAETRLHDEILAYVSYMAPTSEEQTVVTSVESCFRGVLQKPFSQCQVHVFGSTATGLRLPGSDIDLIIETSDTYDIKKILLKLSDAVKSTGWCQSVTTLPRARVPIITFSTTPQFGSIKFDVGINNVNGLHTGAFVMNCLKTMPALRPLVLVIKKALLQNGLNDASKSGISSFAVICMCIFFLQLNPYGLPEEHLANPVESKSLGFILFDFLGYYSRDFPYKSRYISVSQACLAPKDTASWISQEDQSTLVIQCPCDAQRNITRTLSHKNFEKMRVLFTQAHDAIGKATAGSTNILGNLVLVDTKFIDYREHIRLLVQSGSLARAQASNTAGGLSVNGSSSRRRRRSSAVPVLTDLPNSLTKGPATSPSSPSSRTTQHPTRAPIGIPDGENKSDSPPKKRRRPRKQTK